ncbi:3285_t:CDS:1 [Ambispora gerdemannii]|uniref:MFS-type drug efflux transporter P55 n=1 Tax=Ambispora gerdemannii TaxID=144530 RepID=A0A9N9F3E6_9GLOM|nr:3285_t:CDS:1 [Ambispora gerdemannii]
MAYENFLRNVDSFGSQSRVDQDIRVEISGNDVVSVRESTEIQIEPNNDTVIADDNEFAIVEITDDNEFTLVANRHNLDRNKSFSENTMNCSHIYEPTYVASVIKRLLIFFSLTLSIFLAAADQLIMSNKNIFTLVAKEFNVSSSSANNWIGSVNLITSVAATPIFGKLSDIFGRKNIFITVLGTFTIGSVFCGVSQNIAMIIIGRIISGIGAGGMTTLASTITSEIVYVKSRGIYQGILGAVFAFATVVGPLLGGIFNELVSWRWTFYMNIQMAVSSTIIIIFLLDDNQSGEGSFRDKLRKVDYYGIFAFSGLNSTLLLTLILGVDRYNWDSPIILSLIGASILLLIFFLLIELKLAIEPIIPFHLFKTRNTYVIYICNFITGIALYGLFQYLPIYFEIVKESSITKIVLDLWPLVSSMVLSSIIAGYATTNSAFYCPWITVGYATLVFAFDLLTRLKESTDNHVQIVCLLLAGIGIGSSMQSSLLSAQRSVHREGIAIVTSHLIFFRLIGMAFGVVICGSIFNNTLDSHLEKIFLENDVSLHEIENSATLVNDNVHSLIVSAYTHALHRAFQVGIPCVALVTLISLLLRHVPFPNDSYTRDAPEE